MTSTSHAAGHTHTTPEALPKFTGSLEDLTAFTEGNSATPHGNLPKPGDLVVCIDASGGGGVNLGATYRVDRVHDEVGEYPFLKPCGFNGAYAFRFAPFPQASTEAPRAFQVGDLVVRADDAPKFHWWTPGKVYKISSVVPGGTVRVVNDEGDTLQVASNRFSLHTPVSAKSPTEPTRASVTFLPGIGKLTPSEENAEKIDKAAEAICEAFSWDDTAEGAVFWEDICMRLEAYSGDIRAAIPAPAPEPLDMRGLSAKPGGCFVRLDIAPGAPHARFMSPAAARALAEQLVANAEAVERAAR